MTTKKLRRTFSSSTYVRTVSVLLFCSIMMSMVLIQMNFGTSRTLDNAYPDNILDNITSTCASTSCGNNTSSTRNFDFIFGYSSSGKSTYINQKHGDKDVVLSYFQKIGFKGKMTERELFLRFDKWLREETKPEQHVVIHANIFCLLQNREKYSKFVHAVLNYPAIIHAIGMVTEPESLLSNMRDRTTVENGEGEYSEMRDLVVGLVDSVDLPGIFYFFVEEYLLSNTDIEIDYIQSKPNFKFEHLPDLKSTVSILTSKAAPERKVKEFHHHPGFHPDYNTPLPFDLQIQGKVDYKEIRDIIFENVNVVNKSILDIHSAYGYFSLEVAKAGAASVRGIELGIKKRASAVTLKKLWGIQNVNFLPLSIFEPQWNTPFGEDRYDVVFLMNIIHETPNPIHMLRLAAGMAKDALVIDLPQLKDKFSVEQHDTILVVNSKSRFDLTSAAVQKILISDFESFKEIVSPRAGRILLICFTTKA